MAKERQLAVMTAEITLPTLDLLSQIMHEINDSELRINQELEKAKAVVSAIVFINFLSLADCTLVKERR